MKSYQQVSNVVLENDKVRVIEIQFGPGEKLPMHSHPNYVIYALTNSRNKFTHPDGTTEVIDLREGQSVWRDAEEHEVENIGMGDTRAILIEIK